MNAYKYYAINRIETLLNNRRCEWRSVSKRTRIVDSLVRLTVFETDLQSVGENNSEERFTTDRYIRAERDGIVFRPKNISKAFQIRFKHLSRSARLFNAIFFFFFFLVAA